MTPSTFAAVPAIAPPAISAPVLAPPASQDQGVVGGAHR
jgi:hypothetical protein